MSQHTGSYNHIGIFRESPSSGIEFSNSASFTGDDWAVIFGPQQVFDYSNLAVTIANNGPEVLESASVEFSPNNSQWETDWDKTTFAGLAVDQVDSLQVTGNSRRYMRVRAIPSGSGGALTGSAEVFLHVNDK